MTDSQPHTKKPTSKQLRYLRNLAMRSGESFVYPHTTAEASAEIGRLRGRKRSAAGERRREVAEVRRAMAERSGDGAATRPDEIVGFGSSATWR